MQKAEKLNNQPKPLTLNLHLRLPTEDADPYHTILYSREKVVIEQYNI